MVVPPGWNVTEPIGLAVRLYRVAEQLRSAPAEADLFVARIKSFSHALQKLQKILENGDTAASSTDGLQALETAVNQSQSCVLRCENFSQRFFGLVNDAGVQRANVGQAAKWVWKREDVSRLAAEMDTHIQAILLGIGIETLAQMRSPRNTNFRPILPPSGPARTETSATLPPYSSPSLEPQEIRRKPVKVSKVSVDEQSLLSAQFDTAGQASPLGPVQARMSQTYLPPTPRSTSWQPSTSPYSVSKSSSPLTPYEKRRSTDISITASPAQSLGGASRHSRNSSCTYAGLPASLATSPDLGFLDNGAHIRHESLLLLDEVMPELSMENLQLAFVSFERKMRRFKIPIDKIQAFFIPETRRRYLVFHPLPGSNTKYYLKSPAGRPLIPHIEHPNAHGSWSVHQITFQERIEFISERTALRRQSGASSIMTEMSTDISSADSIRSNSSTGSTSSGAQFVKESGPPEFDFGGFDDCRRFQQLVLGQGIDLVVPQFPVEGVVTIRAKVSTKEKYRTDYLKDRPVKSKKSVQLEIQLSSSQERRGSELRDSITHATRYSPTTTTGEPGLTRPTDLEDLKSLDYLKIDFSREEDKKRFLQHAKLG